jgi:hypothetical protein
MKLYSTFVCYRGKKNGILNWVVWGGIVQPNKELINQLRIKVLKYIILYMYDFNSLTN